MDQAPAKPVKWWHVCLAIAGLVVMLTILSRQSFRTNQVYSEKIAPGTTPVIEDESHSAPASGSH